MYYILGGIPPRDIESLKALGPSALYGEMVYYLIKVQSFLSFFKLIFLFCLVCTDSLAYFANYGLNNNLYSEV